MANDAQILFGSLGYFIIVGTLLGLSGVAGSTVIIPTNPAEQDEGSVDQSFGEAVVECIFTLFGDCDQQTESSFWSTLSAVVIFAFNFLGFFFQLLTFTLPIPVWLNAIIVLPPAVAVIYVGMKFVRGGG